MSIPLEVPHSYAQWSNCLDRLSTGLEDEVCLSCMAIGKLSWTGGVSTLFADRLGQEFNIRLIRCAERLTRDLQFTKDESSVVKAILNARQSLHFLHRLAQTPSFPELVRTHWMDEVRKFAQRSQNSLEASAKTDRTGRLAVLLRNNNLLWYEQILSHQLIPKSIQTNINSASVVSKISEAGTSIRRRNILT